MNCGVIASGFCEAIFLVIAVCRCEVEDCFVAKCAPRNDRLSFHSFEDNYAVLADSRQSAC